MASAKQIPVQPSDLTNELNAEQALGLVSYGLMQRLTNDGQIDLPWLEAPNRSHDDCLRQLRQRLELTALAIDTGAPLTTAEVSMLLGARPGAETEERGGLKARKVSRNVWRLSRIDDPSGGNFRDDRFRRRL